MVRQLIDDVDVAGLACRLPVSDNAEEFWSHLMNNEEVMSGIVITGRLDFMACLNIAYNIIKHFD